MKCPSKQHWQDEESAKEVLQTLLRRKKLTIESVTYKTNTIETPLLFNLNELLILCNEELGLSSFEIINILNSLYLRGFISYPFTTGNNISSNRWKQIPEILRSSLYKDSFADHFENLQWGKFNKKIMGADADLFQGIIPTNKVPSVLDRKEQAIYNRIAARLIVSVSSSFNYESLSLDSSVLNYSFKGETGCTQNNCCPKGIDNIDPAGIPFSFVVKLSRKIDGILVFQEFCFLQKAFIFIVENIIHQIVSKQSIHPSSCDHQRNVSYS